MDNSIDYFGEAPIGRVSDASIKNQLEKYIGRTYTWVRRELMQLIPEQDLIVKTDPNISDVVKGKVYVIVIRNKITDYVVS